jgi:hypothetical protein
MQAGASGVFPPTGPYRCQCDLIPNICKKRRIPRTWIRIAPLVNACVTFVAWFLHLIAGESLRWLCVVCVAHCSVCVVATRGCVVVWGRLGCRRDSPHCGYYWQRLLGTSPTVLTLPSNIWVTEIRNIMLINLFELKH